MSSKVTIVWTAAEQQSWLRTELMQGRLRQGWGGPNTQLTEKGIVVSHTIWAKRFSDWVASVWGEAVSSEDSKKRHSILLRMVSPQRGDLVVVPRLPHTEEFVIGKVGDGYTFDDSQFDRTQDFGHTMRLYKESLRTFGYKSSPEAKLIVAKFRHYRSAVNNVADPAYAQVIQTLYNTVT